MQIKSIVAAAAIALITGVGSVSAEERNLADPFGDVDGSFKFLNGIAASQMTAEEMGSTVGTAVASDPFGDFLVSDDRSSSSHTRNWNLQTVILYEDTAER